MKRIHTLEGCALKKPSNLRSDYKEAVRGEIAGVRLLGWGKLSVLAKFKLKDPFVENDVRWNIQTEDTIVFQSKNRRKF